jgi:threonyl-tRNA synthetase
VAAAAEGGGGSEAAAAAAAARRGVGEEDVGGGSFYGPKIDGFVRDALGREHQCATVQLDFQLPARFGLRFKGDRGEERQPVLIHRAVLGSLERMMGVLMEHTAGKWPFWLSPRQVVVCPVAERHAAHARAVAEALMRQEVAVAAVAAEPAPTSPAAAPLAEDTGLWVDVDESSRTVGKKVREAQVAAYNLIAVVGDAEVASGGLAMRFRDAATLGAFEAARASLGLGLRSGALAAAASPEAAHAPMPAAVAADAAAAFWSSPLVPLESVAKLRAICRRMALLRL